MTDKSYVTMEQHVCVCCGKPYDTGALLLDQRLRPKFDMHTITAVAGMCPECKKYQDDGYVQLVEIDEQKSKQNASGNYNPENVYRTGTIARVRLEVFSRIFNVPAPPGGLCFVNSSVTHALEQMTQQTQEGP